MKSLLSILLFALCLLNGYGQPFRTEPLSSEIHSIQINKSGNWRELPIIKLNSNEFIQLNFDRFGDNSSNRLRYRLIYCNADWTKSTLSDIEYLDGFNDNLIEDSAFSVNTNFNYTNFILDVPNNNVSVKLSGNYAIEVYEEDDPQNILLNACFSVSDMQIALGANISSLTMVDANRAHQQVSFTINHPSLSISNPFTDLYVVVRQNNRLDNERAGLKPTFVQGNKLVYEQNRRLTFEAGNEYRRFDIPSHRYNGLRIAHISFENPYYHAWVIPDRIKAGTRYVYDEDQNGRFLIRNAESEDSNVEADYFFVNFTLGAEQPFLENVYINGAFTYDLFMDKYQMEYDYTDKAYRATLLLKQGAYNYQYLLDKGSDYSAVDIEGSYHETENEYQIYVYYRRPGQRYDSLIGFLTIKR